MHKSGSQLVNRRYTWIHERRSAETEGVVFVPRALQLTVLRLGRGTKRERDRVIGRTVKHGYNSSGRDWNCRLIGRLLCIRELGSLASQCADSCFIVTFTTHFIKYVMKFSIPCILLFNRLKPTGYVMHQQFNIQQLYALPTVLTWSGTRSADLLSLFNFCSSSWHLNLYGNSL